MSEQSPDPVQPSAGNGRPSRWRLNVAPQNRDLLPYYRVYVASVAVGAAAIPLAVVLLLVSLIFRLAVPSSVFLLIIALATLCMALNEAISLRLLLRQDQWWGLSGQLVRRLEQPRRFRNLVAMKGLVLLVTLGAGVFLIWSAVTGP